MNRDVAFIVLMTDDGLHRRVRSDQISAYWERRDGKTGSQVAVDFYVNPAEEEPTLLYVVETPAQIDEQVAKAGAVVVS